MRWKGQFVAAGEMVTCENGHEIATVARGLSSADPMSVEDFDWKIAAPYRGDAISGCPICGAPYVRERVNAGVCQLHIGGEWRP